MGQQNVHRQHEPGERSWRALSRSGSKTMSLDTYHNLIQPKHRFPDGELELSELAAASNDAGGVSRPSTGAAAKDPVAPALEDFEPDEDEEPDTTEATVPLEALTRMGVGVSHELGFPCEVLRTNGDTLTDYCQALVNVVTAYDQLYQSLVAQNREAISEKMSAVKKLRDRENVPFILTELQAVLLENAQSTRRLAALAQRLSTLRDAAHLPSLGDALIPTLDDLVRPPPTSR